jgi:hypothetical protein
MARIIGGIGDACPLSEQAIADGKQNDPYWAVLSRLRPGS